MSPSDALRYAEELDRMALLHNSRGDRPLMKRELALVIEVLMTFNPREASDDGK